MSAGASTDAAGFMLDDSAQQAAPVPAPPDVARYIPTATLEDAQRQQQANEWDQQARQKIADMWDQQSQATQNDAVQRWLQPPRYGPPVPTTYEPVQQPQAQAQPPPDVNPVTAEPTQNPVVQQLMDGLGGLVDKMREGAVAHGPAVQQAVQEAPAAVAGAALNPLDTGVQAVNAVNSAAGSPQPPAPTPEEATQDQQLPDGSVQPAPLTQQQAEAAKLMGNVVAGGPEGLAGPVATGVDLAKLGGRAAVGALERAGVGLVGPSLRGERAAGDVVAGMGISPQGLPGKSSAGNDALSALQDATRAWEAAGSPTTGPAADAYVASIQAAPDDVDLLAAGTAGVPTLKAGQAGDVVAGMGISPQGLPDALVTAAKNMMGEDRFAAAQKILARPATDAKFAASKNLDRDLKTQAQQDAYAIWRQAKNMEGAPAEAAAATGATDALPGSEIFDEPSQMGAQPPPEPNVAAAAQPRLTPPPHTLDEPAPYTGAGDSVLAQHPAVQALNNVQSVLKQAVIGGSVFHPLVLNEQLARTALGAGGPLAGAKAAVAANRGFVDSGFAKSWMADNADTIARAEDAGATNMRIGSAVNSDAATVSNQLARSAISAVGSGVAGFTSAKLSGQSNEDALKRAGLFAAGGVGVARVAPAINEALWGRFVPIAKTEAFKMLEPQVGAEVAAKRVNDIFGGQNLAKLGRNPEFQTLAKATFLAPDWMESWARNAGAALKPGAEGAAARRWWLATGVSTGLTLEGLNMALAGHPTWENEPGHQFQLETTNLLNGTGQNPGGRRTYLDVMGLGPLGSTLNAASKANSANPLDVAGAVGGRLAENHLNVVPGATLRAAQNFANGHQIVPQGTPPGQAALPEVGAAASSILPIPLSGFTNESISPAVSAVGGITGLRPSEGSAYSPAVQQAFQKTGTAINPTPNTLALGSGAQVPVDAGMKHEYQNALGAFLAEHVKEIDSPEAAAQLRQAGEKVAMAAVLDKHPELTGKAVSTKQVAVQKAEQKAGVAPGTFWKGASGPTPIPAASAPAVASPAAKQPTSGTFWKAAA